MGHHLVGVVWIRDPIRCQDVSRSPYHVLQPWLPRWDGSTNSGRGMGWKWSTDGIKNDKNIHKLIIYINHDVQCFFLIFISFLQLLYFLTPKLNDEVILNPMRVRWHPNSRYFICLYYVYVILIHTTSQANKATYGAFARLIFSPSFCMRAWQNINIHQIGSGFFAKRQEDVWASDGRGVSV